MKSSGFVSCSVVSEIILSLLFVESSTQLFVRTDGLERAPVSVCLCVWRRCSRSPAPSPLSESASWLTAHSYLIRQLFSCRATELKIHLFYLASRPRRTNTETHHVLTGNRFYLLSAACSPSVPSSRFILTWSCRERSATRHRSSTSAGCIHGILLFPRCPCWKLVTAAVRGRKNDQQWH